MSNSFRRKLLKLHQEEFEKKQDSGVSYVELLAFSIEALGKELSDYYKYRSNLPRPPDYMINNNDHSSNIDKYNFKPANTRGKGTMTLHYSLSTPTNFYFLSRFEDEEEDEEEKEEEDEEIKEVFKDSFTEAADRVAASPAAVFTMTKEIETSFLENPSKRRKIIVVEDSDEEK
jgi:hypothetical protein